MNPLKILIVEDDPTSVILLKTFLARYDVEIHTAGNGKDAVTMFIDEFTQNKPYDLIFMDIMMPKLDGTEALIQIKQYEESCNVSKDKQTKVIMTTAIDDKKIILKTVLQGNITAYLTKPLDIGRLKTLLHKIMAEHRSE